MKGRVAILSPRLCEIAVAKSKLQPHDTGHIHTSISYLESRVEDIQKEIDEDLRKAAYAY